MRIITGKLKGRQVRTTKGQQVRPTTDRTKESIFNVIEARLYMDGSMVLDLFAGSGNLGIEAISRGSKHLIAVDKNPTNIKQIDKNAERLGIDHQVRTVCTDVLQYLDGMPIPHHFIFCDPPYQYPQVDELIDKVLNEGWLADSGWFIFEHDIRHDFDDHPNCFFTKRYGRTYVSIFQKHPVDSDTDS
ncbi:MAG: 16S rRNA (guanine(966)-N(2))-methyltransferase RsmD [Balneolaceae bacterium]|nr:16S rRNA (guanine(966)-N(2))-methyltransferase RsmD [Balneolaceae bacterium]